MTESTTTTHDDLFIGGRFVPAESGARLPLVDPATEEVFAHVPDAGEADVDRAVAAAGDALAGWRDTPAEERAALLLAVADQIDARAEEMDHLITRENGAPRWWTSFVGSGSAAVYRAAAEVAKTYRREEVRQSPSGRSLFRNDPVGVVGAIVPWNSPQVLIASKLGPALAAGCTVVLKPSPETTLDGFLLGELLADAGLPAGVVNIVSGGRGTGAALVAHEGVRKVSFTGSTVAGRAIARVCGEQLKPVSAELGGKSAVVILDDADIDAFEASIIPEVVPYSGQVCYANSRVLVHRSRFDEVVDRLRETMAGAPLGDPTDPATVFGPIVTAAQRDKVEGYIRSGVEEGARLALGGGRPAGLDRGYYVEPTIFIDVQPSMRIFQEEIFGPVVAVVPFDHDDQAVALANDSGYGLAGGVFGGDLERATAVARRLETGRIIVNGARGASRYSSLWKGSGLGSVGEIDLEAFLQPRNITQPG